MVLALITGLAAAASIALTVASHATTSGCIVDKPLYDAAILCAVFGALLGVGAAVTGLSSLTPKAGRAQGTYLRIGIAGTAVGVISGFLCLAIVFASIGPHAINPAYLHPC